MRSDRRSGPRGTFWPTPRQRRLLEVALAAPDQAVRVWRALQPDFVLDELEPGSFDLMALIYKRLAQADYHDSVVERLKGIYRREWVRANVLVEHTRQIDAALRAIEVHALYVEGAPLAERFYPERGLRPSWFIDVLVRPDDATRALSALAVEGWLPNPDADEPTAASTRWPLINADRSVCVLRTSLSTDFVLAGSPTLATEVFWQDAVSCDLNGVAVPTLNTTESLLAVCVAGARPSFSHSLLWLLDCAFILRADQLDSERLIELAAARGQALRLRDALTYLSTLPDVPVPSGALEALARVHVSPRERLIQLLASGSLRGMGALPEYSAQHLAATGDSSLRETITSFPAFLASEWGLSSSREIPSAFAQRLVRQLRERRGGAAPPAAG
jgi:hypothetical protein